MRVGTTPPRLSLRWRRLLILLASLGRVLISMVQLISQVETDVLLFGETGTGKDLVARSIHERSNRSGRHFVASNCVAVPESTIESELFGPRRVPSPAL